MILLFKYISELAEVLVSKIENQLIIDFRINVNINNQVSLFLLVDDSIDCSKDLQLSIIIKDSKLDIEIISKNERDEDPFYVSLWESKEKVILESRKRLSNLLESDNLEKYQSSSKVITFYSYKGGVGRSTTLASCASYLATHYDQKIVIIDCDLEAPGFTNYFLSEPSEINYQNGLVEFILDSNFSDVPLDIEQYLWEVGKEYTDNGSIYVMPAGNLSEEMIKEDSFLRSHKRHYLEGLARIDLSSKFLMRKNFDLILSSIEKSLNPDLILIDSRTGFNDIFGLSAFHLSDLVIGFFGSNAQSVPGLKFFVRKIDEIKEGLNAIIINSIISRRSSFVSFERNIEDFLQELPQDETEEIIAIKAFPLTRYSLLETIGTEEENKTDFIDLIKNKRFPDYNEVFDYIFEIVSDLIKNEDNKQGNEEYSTIDTSTEKSPPNNNQLRPPTYTQKINAITSELLRKDLKPAYDQIQAINLVDERRAVQKLLKKKIIKKLSSSWPQLYGEQFDELRKESIFYRKSMEDIFNPKKIIILGNKGTGKTYLYEALKHPEVVAKIRQRANRQGNYEFFHMVDSNNSKFIDTGKFDTFEIQDEENFYTRFWVIFIWNAIMLDSVERLGYSSPLNVFPIKNDTKTRNWFKEIIESDEAFIKIEEDLENLDFHLKTSREQKNIIVIFDRLDLIVKPIDWSKKIVPLINFWRNNGFHNISPKLFLRSDLLERLSNITNVKELKNQAISIEWNQEELFGYFFKLVLTTAKEEFYRYMSFTQNNQFELIKQIKNKSGKDNQPPLDEHYLKPLVLSFFGKYASRDNSPRYGESYDWFYRNLKNANDTISLRPFIDLLHKSFEMATEDYIDYPILPAHFFAHGEARKTAVKNHIDDLASEAGNEDLRIILNFIREKKYSRTVFLDMEKWEMDLLLEEIIKTSKLENSSVKEIIYLLTVNGIIYERFINRGRLTYTFAYLYKYYLGLKSKKAGFYKNPLHRF